jgi:hypothetical protein
MAATTEVFDATARKFHQYLCVILLVIGFVIGGAPGLALEAIVGVVLLVGRYWWPADIFRQITWRFLEPAGLLHRRDVQEDHSTRRVARVLGGVVILVSGALIAAGLWWAWLLIGLIGLMIFLDASFDFCALCWLSLQYGRLRARAAGGPAA